MLSFILGGLWANHFPGLAVGWKWWFRKSIDKRFPQSNLNRVRAATTGSELLREGQPHLNLFPSLSLVLALVVSIATVASDSSNSNRQDLGTWARSHLNPDLMALEAVLLDSEGLPVALGEIMLHSGRFKADLELLPVTVLEAVGLDSDDARAGQFSLVLCNQMWCDTMPFYR
jgi:hypothetical protein